MLSSTLSLVAFGPICNGVLRICTAGFGNRHFASTLMSAFAGLGLEGLDVLVYAAAAVVAPAARHGLSGVIESRLVNLQQITQLFAELSIEEVSVEIVVEGQSELPPANLAKQTFGSACRRVDLVPNCFGGSVVEVA